MDIEAIHTSFLNCGSISIDTRKITPGCMFVAVKGERFDANTFAAEAIEHGAHTVIIDNPKYLIDERCILVEDSLSTLQELAKYHRSYLGIPIIGLTGSNGKTTTKELIHAVLSKKYNTKATVGNLNNHIGVPLTLLSFSKETEIGIVEMGANHLEEIRFLSEIAQPDFGYITNFGKAHLEGFGSAEGVVKAKSELYEFLSANGKTAVVNLNDPIQVDKTATIDRYTFGVDSDGDVNFTEVRAKPFVAVELERQTMTSQLIGHYNATNICAAIAIGKMMSVPEEAIKSAIENYAPDNNRSQLMSKGSNEIILDAYNANPSSMAAAIENFLGMESTNKMMILGDMFELGSDSRQEHYRILELLEREYTALCHFIGKEFFDVRIPKDNFHFYETFDELAEQMKVSPPENKLILIKGSRGMALERILDYI